MNAAAIRIRFLWILFRDETGNCGSFMPPESWRGQSLETLEQLVRALHPEKRVISARWAEGAERIMGDDTLIVSVPGTHEVKQPKAKVRVSRVVDVAALRDEDDGRPLWHDGNDARLEARELRKCMGAAKTEDDAARVEARRLRAFPKWLGEGK